jgi:hypothetical protein
LMVFADARYSRPSKQKKLPLWIRDFLRPENCNLSVDRALSQARAFLKRMAAPFNVLDGLATNAVLDSTSVVERNKELQTASNVGGEEPTDDSTTTQ